MCGRIHSAGGKTFVGLKKLAYVLVFRGTPLIAIIDDALLRDTPKGASYDDQDLAYLNFGVAKFARAERTVRHFVHRSF